MKKVYITLVADLVHPGHLNIVQKARELGEVTVGLYSDQAIASLKRLPYLSYDQRKLVVENIKGVANVIKQETLDYTDNLKELKPDYVVHGNDWKKGASKNIRESVVSTLKEWGGELIEVEYTQGLNTNSLIDLVRKSGTTPGNRLSTLRYLINSKPVVRILEVHNGLSGLIAETTSIEKDGEKREFDGMWESSLTDSTSKGKPDTQAVDISSRVQTIEQILEVTTKPMIVDADNGGLTEHFTFTVRTLERLGVSAVIIEDKIGAKRNSLFGTDVKQTQDSPEEFAAKIVAGKKAQVTDDFMVIARCESLILKQGHDDAINRAKIYIDAGADGIMIHSKEKEPTEILEFCRRYNKLSHKVPLVVVPSSYATITENELHEAGVKVVIYANHLLRSAFPAMVKAAESILENESCDHASKEYCMPIKQIITLIPESH